MTHRLIPDGCNMVRLISQPTSDQHTEIRRILWDGHEGLDWASEFSAKADTSRISLLYDRTFTFNPRNERVRPDYSFVAPNQKDAHL